MNERTTDTLSLLALHRPPGVPDAPADYWGMTAGFVPGLPTTDRRMIVWNAQGYPLDSLAEGPDSRLGSAVAETLTARGYRITGLVVEKSTPGMPVYAVKAIPEACGIRAAVYTGPHHSPNGGISSRVQWVTIVGPEVPDSLRRGLPTDDAPAVKVRRLGRDVVLEPVEAVPAGHVGYMSSGAYAHVSGMGPWWSELVGHDSPIRLHDRTETVGLYNALSD